MSERGGEGPSGRTRVVVVDDHHAVRAGIGAALLTATDIELVGEAATGEDALRLCQQVRPDVVIMDLKLPGVDGITAIRHLRQHDPEVRILALTSFPDEYWVQEALVAGATGYLLKNIELDALLAAIRATHRGRLTLALEAIPALQRTGSQGASGTRAPVRQSRGDDPGPTTPPSAQK